MTNRIDPTSQEKRLQESARFALMAMPVCLATTQPRAAGVAHLLLWYPCECQSADELITAPPSRRSFLHEGMDLLRRFLPKPKKDAQPDSTDRVAPRLA